MINSVLKAQVLPISIAYDYYFGCLFCPTRLNPADDPTRHRRLRGALRPRPAWWDELAAGRFHTFDQWLALPPQPRSTSNWAYLVLRLSALHVRGQGRLWPFYPPPSPYFEA